MSWGDRDRASVVVDWRRKVAWILVIVAIVFWLWFGIGSAMVEEGGWFNWLMHILIPGGIFILSALITLRWQQVGGVALTIMGVIAIAMSLIGFIRGTTALAAMIMMLLTLSFPPLISGILFLVDARRAKVVSRKLQSNQQHVTEHE
jgi:hypothetical protein